MRRKEQRIRGGSVRRGNERKRMKYLSPIAAPEAALEPALGRRSWMPGAVDFADLSQTPIDWRHFVGKAPTDFIRPRRESDRRARHCFVTDYEAAAILSWCRANRRNGIHSRCGGRISSRTSEHARPRILCAEVSAERLQYIERGGRGSDIGSSLQNPPSRAPEAFPEYLPSVRAYSPKHSINPRAAPASFDLGPVLDESRSVHWDEPFRATTDFIDPDRL